MAVAKDSLHLPQTEQLKWGFPKIGDPNKVPEIVGALLQGPQSKVPHIFGNSQIMNSKAVAGDAFRPLWRGPVPGALFGLAVAGV